MNLRDRGKQEKIFVVTNAKIMKILLKICLVEHTNFLKKKKNFRILCSLFKVEKKKKQHFFP